MMTKRVRSLITGTLNEVDEKLLEMAQNRTGNMDESACYDAIREIRLKRLEIRTRFERRFINLFEVEIRLLQHPDEYSSISNRNTAGHKSYQDNTGTSITTVEKSLDVVRKDCGQVLLELDKKFGLLLDTPKSTNPMQPEMVFEAFQEACWDIKSGDEVRLMMLRIFGRRVTGELQSIYEGINKLLEDKKYSEGFTDMQVDKVTSLCKHEQTAVMLRYEVANRIENKLSGHEVPDFIRSFLLKHWRIFLEDIYKNYSEHSIAWNAARQTMDDLIWIVSKPHGLWDRQCQVQLLPSLLFRLLNGMKVIAMDEADIEQFLKQLREYQLRSMDINDAELLDTITAEAKENVNRSHGKTMH